MVTVKVVSVIEEVKNLRTIEENEKRKL